MSSSSSPTTPRPRAALVTFRGYQMHPRREAEALVEAGYSVDVICLRREGESRSETQGHLRWTRFSLPKTRNSLLTYAASYVGWFLVCAVLLTARHLRRRYTVIQISTLPDHQVFAAAIPKLLGAKVILFLKEPMRELFHTLYAKPRLTQIIGWLELRSIAFADYCFTVTEAHRQGYVARGADPWRIRTVVNSTPTSALRPTREGPKVPAPDGTVTMICPGTIEPRWGYECILRAMALARPEVPGLRLLVTGEGSYTTEMLRLAAELGIEDCVVFEGWVSLERLQQVFSLADIGLATQQASEYSHIVHTGKMYEFMLFGIPCICSRLRATRDYFDDSVLTYFTPDDHEELAQVMIQLGSDPPRRQAQAERAARAFVPYAWEAQKRIYLDSIQEVVAGRLPSQVSRSVPPGSAGVA